jgi:hypothetical protein
MHVPSIPPRVRLHTAEAAYLPRFALTEFVANNRVATLGRVGHSEVCSSNRQRRNWTAWLAP